MGKTDKRISYRLEDFLKDDTFIHYVLNTSSEAVSDWEQFLEECPDVREEALRAAAILLAPFDVESGLTAGEKDKLKETIFRELQI